MNKMETRHYYKAEDFLAQAEKIFLKDEARYGLIYSISRALEANPHQYGNEAPWFCTVSADPKPFTRMGSEMYSAAWRTPPHMVGVAHFSGSFDAIAEQLVIAVSRKYKEIPGVVGDKGLADRFAARWCGKFGLKVQNTQAQRVYKLIKVNDIPMTQGKLRVAMEVDRDLVVKWSHAFQIDCFGPSSKTPESDPVPYLAQGKVFLWEVNGKPVSIAVKNRATEKGVNVGGVYTPPELRKKGYATTCVAELSKQILQSGKQFCMLYTDLANPTSNSIYKKMGYVEVADSVQHEFGVTEK
jgi:uncharacterized protein